MKRLVSLLGLVLLLTVCGCSQQSNTAKPTASKSIKTTATKEKLRLSSVNTNLPANQHIVKKNETIGDIAEKYHVDIGDFLKKNPGLANEISGNPTPSKGTQVPPGNVSQAPPSNASQVPQDVVNKPLEPDQKVNIPANESLTGYEEEVLKLTNQERQKEGLSPCAGTDSSLNRSAKAKSEDMATHNYFSHESPTYGDPFSMMRNFGVQYQSAGENIAKGQPTPQEVVTAWMNSPEHRKNIMNGSYNFLGVGYVLKNGEAYWTQQFIGKK